MAEAYCTMVLSCQNACPPLDMIDNQLFGLQGESTRSFQKRKMLTATWRVVTLKQLQTRCDLGHVSVKELGISLRGFTS